ncbi:MAG: SMP-30/gluconolactonase/LRE family protein [Actinocatenispora sp.]
MPAESADAPEQYGPPCAQHGEGPVWDADAGVIRWVDMLAGDIMSAPPHSPDSAPLGNTAITRRHVGVVAAALRPRRAGGLVVAVERGFTLLGPDHDAPPQPLPELWSDTGIRMNDGGCDPQGRFYCGSMAYDEAPGRGTLYRLDPAGDAEPVLDGATISNGLAWSPDGRTAYYVDTPTQRIDAFDFDAGTGTLHNRRPVAHIDEADGSPDGLTVDAEGHLWVALWCGAAVRRYSPDGALEAHLPLPVRHVTACAFGGPELDTLYITTSQIDVTEPERAYAGALFVCRPGVRGLPVLPFAG